MPSPQALQSLEHALQNLQNTLQHLQDVPGVEGIIKATQSIIDVIENVICFMPQTRIATPDGDKDVETLKRGDLLLTATGKAEAVCWVGRQTISRVFADPLRALPVRIATGALAENVPSRDLLISPDHAILVGGVLVQAAALVNGTTIVRETSVPERFTYYHVELEDHALVLAENTPAESFIDNIDRLHFDNWDEHEALFPDGKPVMEMAYPRAHSMRQVPGAVRDLVARRESAISAQPAASAA